MVLKAARHCRSEGSVVNDPLGEPGRTSLYVGLPYSWDPMDGDEMFSPFSWEGSLLGTLTDINE